VGRGTRPTSPAVVMHMVMEAFFTRTRQGIFLRGGVVCSFDPDINSSTFGLVLQEIHHKYPRLPFRDSRAYLSAKSAACAERKRPSCICSYPYQSKTPVAFSALNFTSLFPICHIECFRRSACTSQPLLRLGRYTPVQRFLGMYLGAQTRSLRRGSADVVVYAYV
jgi:hypothetical protein